MVNLSHRNIGKYQFTYAEYEITLRAKWVNHDFDHEVTPRYEVVARAERKNGGVFESFTVEESGPVDESDNPGLFATLFSIKEREKVRDLDTLVEDACNRLRGKIDAMYDDVGVNRAEDTFEARAEAEAAVESWTEVA